jgi:hypothetical protein
VDLDLEWDVPLLHRKGAEERLCGIDVFHEFAWHDEFPDERTQFRNGKCLATFVQNNCPAGKTPALLLTLRSEPKQGLVHTDKFSVFVVNLHEYRASDGDAALSYLATHLDVDITDIEQLRAIADAADPDLVRAFIGSSLDIQHISDWAVDHPERLDALRSLVGGSGEGVADARDLGSTLEALEILSNDDVRTIADFLNSSVDREQRIELLRALTVDATGRHVAGEVLAERTSERVDDARSTVAKYEELLGDATTTETQMQQFIEQHLWLLGLDYIAIRPRRSGPSGAMDFLLERFDGFHDLLELKSPQDPVVKAPDSKDGVAPAPHAYSLSPDLSQALAQALVYRDRLTRHAHAAEELSGLPNPRHPRLIVVIGRLDALPEHRRLALLELNRSLHRVEVVPYDVLGKRAQAMLDTVEAYILDRHEDAGNDDA